MLDDRAASSPRAGVEKRGSDSMLEMETDGVAEEDGLEGVPGAAIAIINLRRDGGRGELRFELKGRV